MIMPRYEFIRFIFMIIRNSGRISIPAGIIWLERRIIMPIFLPGKRNREKAYAAVDARETPMKEVAIVITSEFHSQRRKFVFFSRLT